MIIRKLLLLSYLSCICFASGIFGQASALYNEGMAALQKNDTSAAKGYFKESIARNRDAASFNMLGNIQAKEGTYEARFLALDNFKEAVLREPNNTKFRLDYATLLIQRNKKEGAVEFTNLIKSDPENIEVFLGIAENFKMRFIYNYIWGNYEDLYIDGAYDNYSMAEKCYLRALRIDNFNANVNIGLAELYAEVKEFTSAIMLLTKVNRVKPNILGVNLRLGMYYYKTNQTKSAETYFNNALSLMSEREREIYTSYSVEMFYPDFVLKELSVLPPEEKKAYINKYWSMKDPLFLSSENERLLDHYYRVAYSILYFTSAVKGLEGWKSDRGKVMISFGEPASMSKGTSGGIYSDNWVYDDGMVISFLSYSDDNYFWISRRDEPAYGPGIYYSKMETSGDRYQNYKYDKFAASDLTSNKKYNTPVQINVFKSSSSSTENDVYFTYILPLPTTSNKEEHDYYLSFHNELMNLESKKTGKINRDYINKIQSEMRPAYEIVNTIGATVKPGKHNFAFETRTVADSLVSTLHKEYDFPKFKKDALDISGLLFASKVREGSAILGAIQRKDLYILPKIGRSFKSKDPLYLYYEAYNLTIKADGNTDFEHTITIRESDPPEIGIPFIKIFKSITGFVTGKSDKISLTTAYKTQEKDSQVFIQLDVSQYKPGKYDLSVVVNDKVTGENVKREWQFEIRK